MFEPWNEEQKPEYLGDGVYAWHDGFQVWIGTLRGGHDWHVIALEARTMRQLVAYAEKNP